MTSLIKRKISSEYIVIIGKKKTPLKYFHTVAAAQSILPPEMFLKKGLKEIIGFSNNSFLSYRSVHEASERIKVIFSDFKEMKYDMENWKKDEIKRVELLKKQDPKNSQYYESRLKNDSINIEKNFKTLQDIISSLKVSTFQK